MNKIYFQLVTSKSWLTMNIAYIATAISGIYIMKSFMDFYWSYSKTTSLNKKIYDIIKIELIKRKQNDLFNHKLSYNFINDQRESNTNSNNNQEKIHNVGIQAYFMNRFNNNNNNNTSNISNNNTNNELKSNNSSNTQENKQQKKFNSLNKKNDLEFYYYVYLKCLKSIYEQDINCFETQRRKLFKENNILKYVIYVEKFYSNFKFKEDYLLKRIYKELAFSESLEFDIKFTDINTNSINSKYYEDLELEVPKDLDLEKMNEIIVALFDQTKENLVKLQNALNLNESTLSENEYLIAEHLAFDYAYFKYNLTETQIRKALINLNLKFEIFKGSN